MLDFLFGILIYAVIASGFYCYFIICDRMATKKGLQPKIPIKGWKNNDFYAFLSFFWLFLIIFSIYGEVKGFYVKYIR